MDNYTENFYKYIQKGSRQSAEEIVPLVLELIQPKQVVDIGCGTGDWLSVFKEYGVEDILGIDGDWVDKELLQIPEEKFVLLDLTKPFQLNRKFDLVVSLEVAEHLPEKNADAFVESLVKLGPVILFSAAIPGQGGTGAINHINEQWPEYWTEQFKKQGYLVIDCIRKKIWHNERVEWWYAQNILLFANEEYLNKSPQISFANTGLEQLTLIHPKNYVARCSDIEHFKSLSNPMNMSLKQVLLSLPTVMKKAVETRAKNLFQQNL